MHYVTIYNYLYTNNFFSALSLSFYIYNAACRWIECAYKIIYNEES